MNQQQVPQQNPQVHAAQQALKKKALEIQKKNSLLKRVLIGLAVLILLLGLFFAYKHFSGANGVKRDQYQAVFLTNGQVYFGKLDNPNTDYLKLTDVYYLQVQPNEENKNQNQQLQGDPQLIKLGEEIHGPEDEMRIVKSQVTFWENLKDDSKVVQAINQYKKK